MGKVFVSYSHDDQAEAAKVTEVLTELGVDHFLDSKRIRWGDKITSSVDRALDECLAILVILSPASLESPWVPYEVGHASALGKIVLPYLTDASLEVPLYMRDLSFANSLDDIRTYFTATLPMTGPEARRLERERYLFHDHFHNAEAAAKMGGVWYARWTRQEEDGSETLFEEDALDVWTTRDRVRMFGKDSKAGTPRDDHLVYYPLEGVVSEDGWVVLSYWSAGDSRFCGTALLRRRGGGGARYEGHWRGFESDHYDEEPSYMAGRVVMARTVDDLEKYSTTYLGPQVGRAEP